MQLTYYANLAFAQEQDRNDPLRAYRDQFYFPQHNGRNALYFTGNSLGLQPKSAEAALLHELEHWKTHGVEGHFRGEMPWMYYHRFLSTQTSQVVGAKKEEVVVMNTLTTNLHLMMVSFYRPTKDRYKILIEGGAFPSDQYAVASQAKFHGYDPENAVLELHPRQGEETMRTEDILAYLDQHGEEIALVVLGNVNYLTGQAFEVATIAARAHEKGCLFGLNLAHGAGNLVLKLHEWQVDFAVWCSYKYLNSGPGSLAGCFVHENHADSFDLPRFAGWWGHNKKTRFEMGPSFDPISGAEGWQLSNPPIFQLAALRASLAIFDEVGMVKIREKGDKLTAFLEYLLNDIPGDFCKIITPADPAQRGCQLSIRFKGEPKKLLAALKEEGVICDFREPDIIRAAPAPLYNSFDDVYRFARILNSFAAGK